MDAERLSAGPIRTRYFRHPAPPDGGGKARSGLGRIEVWTSCGAGTAADWRKEVAFWKQAGATHITLTTTFHRRHHHRIAGRSLSDHLNALRRYRDAVADAL